MCVKCMHARARLSAPTLIQIMSPVFGRVLDAAVGDAHVLLRTTRGLYGLGQNTRGQLGLPLQTESVGGWTRIPCALDDDSATISAAARTATSGARSLLPAASVLSLASPSAPMVESDTTA